MVLARLLLLLCFSFSTETVPHGDPFLQSEVEVLQTRCSPSRDDLLLQNTISMVQSRGRARMAESSFVVLAEQPSKPIAQLIDAEQIAHAVLSEDLEVRTFRGYFV